MREKIKKLIVHIDERATYHYQETPISNLTKKELCVLCSYLMELNSSQKKED